MLTLLELTNPIKPQYHSYTRESTVMDPHQDDWYIGLISYGSPPRGWRAGLITSQPINAIWLEQ